MHNLILCFFIPPYVKIHENNREIQNDVYGKRQEMLPEFVR